MSYLSRRMREEGFWLKRRTTIRSGEVELTLTFDVSKLARAFERAAEAANCVGSAMAKTVAGFAQSHLDVELDPWQERMLEAAFADPDAVRRMVDPPPCRTRQMYVSSTPYDGDGEILARLRERVARGERYWLRPFLEADERRHFNREYLGTWPSRREDE